MKKTILCIICLLLVVTLFGCGQPAAPETQPPVTETAAPTTQATVPTTQATVPTVETTVETQPVQTAPMREVPYTTKLPGFAGIYAQPDSGSTYVRDVGQDGVFTITEEAYDDSGNLWGKLKSGLGWVLLIKSGSATARTCPQCGESEPTAIFYEDWKDGDLCAGCSFENFGGVDEKLYCSACGADCTFRGLEDDGRCEDCAGTN